MATSMKHFGFVIPLVFILNSYFYTQPSDALSISDLIPTFERVRDILFGFNMTLDNLGDEKYDDIKVRVKRNSKYQPMWKVNYMKANQGRRNSNPSRPNVPLVGEHYFPKPRPICPANLTANANGTAAGNGTAGGTAANSTAPDAGGAPAPAPAPAPEGAPPSARRRKRATPPKVVIPCKPAGPPAPAAGGNGTSAGTPPAAAGAAPAPAGEAAKTEAPK